MPLHMVPIRNFYLIVFYLTEVAAYLLECEDSSLAAETAAAAAASKPGNFGLLGNCKFSELVMFR